ncbi:4-hydroxy-tetrahydrodipicolinate synthase [Rheinheimera sp. MMS21-TC3]|uniref:4-hydroxy-tetrahydrodipicolinate synthase n=1 Tax=Rheinheimera sp. MMS21-TC3 TaxID=3072790 RepID=UPI0028C4D36A|nr:4-hydroxy-tetrahydrodipicolinate synthase [Rheinheimera sp. MMS21-TC3]WNO60803.1 4-hydroxy-tetrahydrodipicolinate synthase [Rheinheimera sp. MMS21-TC3]
MFKGSWVALVTPMDQQGNIDYISLEQLVSFHLENDTDGLVIMGTTGEASTIAFADQLKVIDKVCQQVKGKIPVIAGNGSNSTSDAIERTKALDKLAIDGFLTVTPFYNKPMQHGMVLHFNAIAAVTDKPILLYNVPGRTGIDLQAQTVATLSKTTNIVGIKEATGSINRLVELKSLCSNDFALLSGDDETSAEFMLQGGHGVISVTANIAPKQMAKLCQLATTNQADAAYALDKTLQGLHRQLFIEANPIPTKWALHKMGLIHSDMLRLPLTPLEPIHAAVIEQALNLADIQLEHLINTRSS